MKIRLILAAPAAVVYLGSVLLANWLTTNYGFVPVGFGYYATAGTFAIGAALVVRDLLQDVIGRIGIAILIALGSALSFLVAAPFIAIASATAFLVSETLDMAVYTPLRRRGEFGGAWWQFAIATSAIVGAVADTVVFLWIAFGRAAVAPSLPGQLIAKLAVAGLVMLIGAVCRAVLRQPVNAESA